MATDTTALNNKDVSTLSSTPTTPYGTEQYIHISSDEQQTRYRRGCLHFTLPSGAGTITSIKLYLHAYFSHANGATVSVYPLTQEAWVEEEVTWNEYSSGNSWVAAGGDFGAQIDEIVIAGSIGSDTPISWELFSGDAAGTPLVLDWGDDVHLLVKPTVEGTTTDHRVYARSREYTVPASRPYIEVTYTEPVSNAKSVVGLLV